MSGNKRIVCVIVFALVFLNIGNLFGKEINVTVDPRIELLAVVQYLSDYESKTGLITDYDIDYKHKIDSCFASFKDHPAVKMFESLATFGFTYDAPPTTMLYLSDPPELEIVTPFSDYLVKRAWDEENLTGFVQALRDFATKSDFMKFFDDNKDFYQEMTGGVADKIGDKNYIDMIENYYGMRQHSYNIILAPLFHPGGFGPRIERADGSFDIFYIGGPKGMENGIPTYGTEKNFRYLAWHEFSHSFVNPLFSDNKDQAKKYSALYKPIKEKMTAQAYPTWEIAVNEHIVRAVTVRLAYIYDGEKAGKQALNNERSSGFIYINGLVDKLKEYEGNRDKYATFADFYPELLTAFDQYMDEYAGKDESDLPFEGNINSVVQDKKNIILIISTHEKDKEAEKRLQEYVEAVQKRFYSNGRVLTDEQALNEDLSNNSIIIYGTLDGNLYLSKLKEDLPFKIDSNSITADSVYEGTDLRYITTWRNPQNPAKGMVIYTAQKTEDVYGINMVFHGPTDYVIANGKDVLCDEYYNKAAFPWKF